MKVQRNFPQLDGLRGVAILLVITFHFGAQFPLRFSSGLDVVPAALLGFGWSGVDLFFVLSGFLITGILLDTRKADNYFGSFFGRRALRIFPLYYSVLCLWFLVLPIAAGALLNERQNVLLPNVIRPELQAWYWTYTQNFANALGQDLPSLSHLWSLAVEEQFYVGWAVVVWMARTPRRTAGIALTGALAALASRLLLTMFGESLLGPNTQEAVHRLTMCRMDSLLAGGALAALARSSTTYLVRAKVVLPLLSGAAFIWIGTTAGGWSWSSSLVQTAGYSVLAVSYASVLLLSLNEDHALARLLSCGVLRSFGKYSYAIYVIHWPIHVEYQRWLSKHGYSLDTRVKIAAYIAMGTACSYLLARVSWELIESPFLQLKTHFEARFGVKATGTVGP